MRRLPTAAALALVTAATPALVLLPTVTRPVPAPRAVAPGVCPPTWGGLSAREGLAVLEACAGLAIVGMNVNTVSPPQDPGGMTALLAGKVALEGLGLIARRAQG